jgi:putative FmdB family regulatory protein
MPIYEYQCQQCAHGFDALQKIADAPLTDCPECGEPKLRKLLSAPNFRLKGGGWYETDFKKDNRRNIAGSDDSSTKSAGTPGSKKEEKSGSGADKKAEPVSTPAKSTKSENK